MIYTVSLNPSVDYVLRVENFTEGNLNRANYDVKIPGGKGIMVSKLLKNLNINSTNIGFLGGYTGDYIRDSLKKLEIYEDFTNIEDDTRINVKLKGKVETEVNAIGPNIREEEIEDFLKKLEDLHKGDLVILSGSIPKSLDKDFYLKIIKILKRQEIEFIIDTSGNILLESLKYNPILVKPNIHELSEVFNKSLKNQRDIIFYGKKLIEMGSKNAIVSMGKDGAMFFDKNNIFYAPPIKGKLINSVGAGDSMIAGFVKGLKENMDIRDCFRLAVSSGTATAFSEDIGSKEFIEEIFEIVKIVKF